MDNREISSLLHEIAVFSELSGENPFKARAFDAAARTVEKYPESVEELSRQDNLKGIKGIGKGIEEAIRNMVADGRSTLLDELKGKFPPGITELLSLSGMGPKRVKLVFEKLGVSTIGELEYACRENRLASLEGFGEKSQANILRSIEFQKTTQESRLYSEAAEIGEDLARLARESGFFSRVDIAGSLRRGKTVFKDIDILLVPKKEKEIVKPQEFLLSLADADPPGSGVISAGETKVSIRRRGLQVDFRVVPAASYPAALQHFTGSKEHNTLLRSRAKGMGLKMSEWGVFKGEEALPTADEAGVYATIGLPWIPPEIREADGEIEAAEKGELPALVEAADIHGMIHVHSRASDGVKTIEELVRECERRGYSYLCLSDHSKTAAYAGGLTTEALLKQAAEISGLNKKLAPFRIFHGIESDILPDGSLDYPDEILMRLDFVIGSIHSKLTMDKETATKRLLAAASHPCLTILGHPSGRLLLSREGYPYDEEKILEALAARGIVLEHNCNPHRLDPDWGLLKRAAGRGIRISINTDAHDIDGFDDMRYGVTMARKAWLPRGAILNCMTAEEIDEFFAKRKDPKNRAREEWSKSGPGRQA
jgi:DNA polymerase (family 10)